MSHIERLIAELCPDGVEHSALGEIATLVRGNGMPKSVLTDSGQGAIHYGQIYTHYTTWATKTISYVTSETGAKLAKVSPGDLIITNTSENLEDVGKAVAWLGQDEIVTGGHATVIKSAQDPKFLSYWLQTPDFYHQKRRLATGTKVIEVSTRNLARIQVPVPPMEVQREIVRILDNFSQLEAELEAELEADLEARRKQYEFYSDVLLTAFDTVQKTQLGELCGIITTGKLNANARTENGQFPFFTCDSEPYTIDTYAFEMQAILISGNGSQLGHVNYYEGKFNAYQRTYILGQFSDGVSVKFMLHILKRYFRRYALSLQRAGSVPYITMPMLQDFPIPLPPLEEQERIVEILDKFDALVNDLSIGLPAELQARRKQYEYYRDQLLTFDELSA